MSEWVEHIVYEGSRHHVISYFGNAHGKATIKCSEPNCIINKPLVTCSCGSTKLMRVLLCDDCGAIIMPPVCPTPRAVDVAIRCKRCGNVASAHPTMSCAVFTPRN